MKAIVSFFLGLILLSPLMGWLAWAMFVNRHDEPLTKEAIAMLSYSPQELSDDENGYLMVIGFTAPADSDWKKFGAELVRHNNKNARGAARWAFDGKAASTAEGAKKLRFSEPEEIRAQEMLKFHSYDDETEFLDLLRSLPQAQINKLLADNAKLISRYEEMQSASEFSETLIYSMTTPFPDYPDIRMTQRLLLSRATLAALSGDSKPLLDFLERDLAFWRLVMRSDTTLVTAMVANALLSHNLRLLQALLTQTDFSASELERLRHLLTPLSAEESSVLRALANELEFVAGGFLAWSQLDKPDQMDMAEYMSMKWFYQPQASVNLYAKMRQPLKELASLPPPEFAARRAAQNMEEDTAGRTDRSPIMDMFLRPYNHVGRVLVGIAAPKYETYIARYHDLAAMLQLTRAVLELRLAGIDAGENPEAVPEFLKQADDSTLNPYTGKPFEWDEPCRRLSFTPQNTGKRVFSAVTLAEIPEKNAACAVATVSPDS